MVLPVLLVRDYGQPGFWLFAVPNVLGAAAMGWVLKSPQQSEALTRAHPTAATAFSLVTIAFHLYVAMWITRALTDTFAPALIVAAVVFFLTRHRPRRETLAGATVYVVSLTLAAIFLIDVGPPHVPLAGPAPTRDLLPLAAVCCFGFLFCPYLDLTFHRARQHCPTPAAARLAFGVGFGVVFFSMILFTLAYAPTLAPVITGHDVVPKIAAALVGAHLICQSGLTLAFHYQTVESRLASRNRLLAVLLVVVVFPLVLGGLAPRLPGAFHLTAGEIGYRAFMSAYALFFPAYVYCRMLPARQVPLPLYYLATLCALPFFFAAFIAGHMPWLLPGLAIVLATRLIPPHAPIVCPREEFATETQRTQKTQRENAEKTR